MIFPHMARNNVGCPRGFQLSNYLPTISRSDAARRRDVPARQNRRRPLRRGADLSAGGLFHLSFRYITRCAALTSSALSETSKTSCVENASHNLSNAETGYRAVASGILIADRRHSHRSMTVIDIACPTFEGCNLKARRDSYIRAPFSIPSAPLV